MAPGSLATARLAHQASQQGWLGGPGHMGGSLRGRGFAPTPNPEPPRSGGGRLSCGEDVQRSFVIYMCVNIN